MIDMNILITTIGWTLHTILNMYEVWYPNNGAAVDASALTINNYDIVIVGIRALRLLAVNLEPLLNGLSQEQLTFLGGFITAVIDRLFPLLQRTAQTLEFGNLEIDPYEVMELFNASLAILIQQLQVLVETITMLIN